MSTVTIDTSVYNKAELYAKMNNLSVRDVVEAGIKMFVGKPKKAVSVDNSSEFEAAMAYIRTISAKGGKPVPAEESGKGAVVDVKYSL